MNSVAKHFAFGLGLLAGPLRALAKGNTVNLETAPKFSGVARVKRIELILWPLALCMVCIVSAKWAYGGSGLQSDQDLQREYIKRISGVVIDRAGGNPVQDAEVTLLKLGITRGTQAKTSTDSEGRFQFSGVADGQYFVRVKKVGYSPGYYSPNPNLKEGSLLKIEKGLPVKSLRIYLDPGGRVSGKVRTPDGRLVKDAEVTCFSKSFIQGLARILPRDSKTTNAKGEYVFDGLSSGQYYLFVKPPTDTQMFAVGRPPRLSLEPGFYPSGGAFEDADTVSVMSGANISDADITLAEAQGFSVSGDVSELPAQESQLIVELHKSTFDMPFGPAISTQIITRSNPRFHFDRLPKGQYTIIIFPAADPQTIFSEATVYVWNSDVSNLHLGSGAGLTISGVIQADPDSRPVTPLDVKHLSIRLTNYDLVTAPSRHTFTTNDGRFVLSGLAPGRSFLEISGLPPYSYVKCLSISGQRCSGSILKLTADSNNVNVDLRIASPAAGISGEVQDAEKAPVSSATVLLYPDHPEEGPMHVAKTDDKGAFAFYGLAPGPYTLYSWAEIEGNRVQDPALISEGRSFGVTVDVSAGEMAHKQLVALPRMAER